MLKKLIGWERILSTTGKAFPTINPKVKKATKYPMMECLERISKKFLSVMERRSSVSIYE
jgi:hypothetical protein